MNLEGAGSGGLESLIPVEIFSAAKHAFNL